MDLVLALAPSSIKRFCYLSIIACVIFIIQFYDEHSQAYWLILTAISFSLAITDAIYKQRVLKLCLAAIISAVVVLLSSFLAPYFFISAVFLTLMTALSLLLMQRYPQYFVLILFINLFAILSVPFKLDNANLLYDRVCYVLAGAFIPVLLHLVFYPFSLRDEIKSYIKITLHNLKILNEEIFSCFIQQAYSENIYLFERRLHLQKNKCMQSIWRLKRMCRADPALTRFLSRIDKIWELMLDCSQLRWRVSDHTVFGICKDELNGIQNEIDRLLDHPAADTRALEEKIKRLEENYQTVLQVTSREPLVFLLFINSLKNLSRELVDDKYQGN